MDIVTFLKTLQNKKVYYKPNPGNGGDALIAYATYRLFKKLSVDYEIITPSSNLDGKIVIFGGGGNLVEGYNNCAEFIESNLAKAEQIIILPHTVSDHKILLSKLNDKVTIICREEYSYNYVKTYSNINKVYLTDDLVLSLVFDKSKFKTTNIDRLLFLVKPRTILSSIYRKDRNSNFYLQKRNGNKELNAFRADKEKTNIEIPPDNLDVSALINYDSSMTNEALVEKTVYNIASFLNQFSVINTNRLHICITGALLGKKVNFFGNSYWKNESVYNYSLKRFPNVNWVK